MGSCKRDIHGGNSAWMCFTIASFAKARERMVLCIGIIPKR